MEFRLSPTALDAGYRLEAHDSVGSTNALALEHAASGDPGRLWVVARQQTSGRGRRGRDWATPQGNLAASLLIVSGGDLAPLATLGFVAGLALADALDAVAPGLPVSVGIDGGGASGTRFELKWPNDVLANGAKLSGILLETARLKGGGYGLAIGIGVNVVAHPADTPYPATSLGELGSPCSAEDLFFALSDAWTDHYRVWNNASGLSRIRTRWLERAAGIGSEIAVRHEGSVLRGIFETIDADCRIVVREIGGTVHHIAAGDVHFGAVATVRD